MVQATMKEKVKAKSLDWESLCDQVITTGEPVIFKHRRKKLVLISNEDFKYFEALEHKRLNELADKALAEGGETIPLEDILKKYGFNE